MPLLQPATPPPDSSIYQHDNDAFVDLTSDEDDAPFMLAHGDLPPAPAPPTSEQQAYLNYIAVAGVPPPEGYFARAA